MNQTLGDAMLTGQLYHRLFTAQDREDNLLTPFRAW